MGGPFTHFTEPGWQPAVRSNTLIDHRRTPVHFRGKKVSGLFQRQRSTGLVFEARVRVNGELRRETFDQATTTAEAVQALDAFKTALRNGHPSAQSRRNGLTLADAYAVYVERLQQDGRAATTLTNAAQRWRHMGDLHDRPLASISRGDTADLIRALRRRKLAGSSIRSIWALGSTIFSLAIEHEFDAITVNPFALVKKLLPPQNKGAKREVTPDLVHTLLDVATERQAPLFALLGLQGLRISEGCGAVWSDIDLDQGTLHVQAQLGPDGKRTPLLKTEGSERVLKLDGRAVSILRGWKAKQMTLGLHRPDDFVLATQSGKPTRRRQAHRTLQGGARRAKLISPGETFRLHDLRSGFAVAALLAGDPPNLVQRMLGHSTSAMTMDLYGKLEGPRGRRHRGVPPARGRRRAVAGGRVVRPDKWNFVLLSEEGRGRTAASILGATSPSPGSFSPTRSASSTGARISACPSMTTRRRSATLSVSVSIERPQIAASDARPPWSGGPRTSPACARTRTARSSSRPRAAPTSNTTTMPAVRQTVGDASGRASDRAPVRPERGMG